MRKKISSVLIVLFLVAFGVSAQKDYSKLIGTWQLVSAKQNGVAQPDNGIVKLKFINNGFFTWVSYNKSNKIIRRSLGGKYTFNGKTYTETVDFVGLGEENKFLNQKHSFAVVIKTNKMYISGKLSNGVKYDEVWQKIDVNPK